MAFSYVVDFTPVLDTSQYAQHDVLFIATEVKDFFADKVNAINLMSVIALDGDDQNIIFDLIFSNADITLGTINGAVNISDADAAKIIGYVVFAAGDVNDTINSRLLAKNGINQIMKSSGTTTSVWISGVLRGAGTPTYSASGMKMKIGLVSP